MKPEVTLGSAQRSADSVLSCPHLYTLFPKIYPTFVFPFHMFPKRPFRVTESFLMQPGYRGVVIRTFDLCFADLDLKSQTAKRIS
jgi:hypothetical protein